MKDARDKDKRVTQEDVEELSRKHFDVKRKPRGENSFVAPHVHFNYQVYLYFTSKIDRQQKTTYDRTGFNRDFWSRFYGHTD